MLNVAIKAARAAGALINRAALDVESVRVAQKQVNDFVTEVDQAAERVIEVMPAEGGTRRSAAQIKPTDQLVAPRQRAIQFV